MAHNNIEAILEHDIDEEYQYKPGERLRGIVKVTVVREPLRVRWLKIQLRGQGSVSWEEPVPRRPDILDTFAAAEQYMDLEIMLIEPEDRKQIQTLKPGGHEYPFQVELPLDIPSSFIGRHGGVTYVAKATLQDDNPYSIGNIISSEPFLVLRELDLAELKEMTVGHELVHEQKMKGILSRGKVMCIARINRRAFVPGEDVKLDLEIFNYSNRAYNTVDIALLMTSTFKAKGRSTVTKQVMSRKRFETEDETLAFDDHERWLSIRLPIPSNVPESNLANCNLIDIAFDVVINAEMTGGSKNYVTFGQPILIGTKGIVTEEDEPVADDRTDEKKVEKFASIKEFKKGPARRGLKDINVLELNFNPTPLAVDERRLNPVFEVDLPPPPANFTEEDSSGSMPSGHSTSGEEEGGYSHAARASPPASPHPPSDDSDAPPAPVWQPPQRPHLADLVHRDPVPTPTAPTLGVGTSHAPSSSGVGMYRKRAAPIAPAGAQRAVELAERAQYSLSVNEPTGGTAGRRSERFSDSSSSEAASSENEYELIDDEEQTRRHRDRKPAPTAWPAAGSARAPTDVSGEYMEPEDMSDRELGKSGKSSESDEPSRVRPVAPLFVPPALGVPPAPLHQPPFSPPAAAPFPPAPPAPLAPPAPAAPPLAPFSPRPPPAPPSAPAPFVGRYRKAGAK